ncbi:helix-turn-helix transcriptional regulator [Chryseobacterium shandongense]|uniref:XRE family transcriptional regulator n=1 Tax=Chryseobacterium shandongense TaxID=1493872 RepID=A0ABM7BA08_9FLAO|nr:helix-turn-helix transcriptional regulator [Chryseobacterium shandongense]AZA95335.1 XRE family transcriptional regulator [Chryseobacterium shandongense]
MEDINRKIVILRNEYELTQAEFAEKLGVSRGHIASIEGGKNKISTQLMNKIFKVFNISDSVLNLEMEDFIEEIKILNKNHVWMSYPTDKEIVLEKENVKLNEMIDLLKENNNMLKDKIKILEKEIANLTKNK